jgi:hypothetical protein
MNESASNKLFSITIVYSTNPLHIFVNNVKTIYLFCATFMNSITIFLKEASLIYMVFPSVSKHTLMVEWPKYILNILSHPRKCTYRLSVISQLSL